METRRKKTYCYCLKKSKKNWLWRYQVWTSHTIVLQTNLFLLVLGLFYWGKVVDIVVVCAKRAANNSEHCPSDHQIAAMPATHGNYYKIVQPEEVKQLWAKLCKESRNFSQGRRVFLFLKSDTDQIHRPDMEQIQPFLHSAVVMLKCICMTSPWR